METKHLTLELHAIKLNELLKNNYYGKILEDRPKNKKEGMHYYEISCSQFTGSPNMLWEEGTMAPDFFYGVLESQWILYNPSVLNIRHGIEIY